MVILDKMKSRIQSDKGASESIDTLLLVVGTVLLVLIVTATLYKAGKKKASQVAECIDKSNDMVITGEEAIKDCMKG